MKKAIILVLCAVLLCGASVLGTLAYLTSQDSVTNTFTVGNVTITLDEAEVNGDGKAADKDVRTDANTYKLVPGKTYDKDPIIHVADGSEKSYLFIKVENGIAAIEDSTNSIASQLVDNGWAPIAEGSNIYYYNTAVEANANVPTFATFTIAGETDNEALATYASETVVVTAYAVQEAGFNTAADAWAATFGK